MPDVRQLLHEAIAHDPVPDLDLDRLAGRVRTRHRRRRVMTSAVALVVGSTVTVVVLEAGSSDNGATGPSSQSGDVVVGGDPATFMERYASNPYLPRGPLPIAPGAQSAFDPELVAVGTIEDVRARGLPEGACAGARPDPSCPDTWYLDVTLRVDDTLVGPDLAGGTVVLPFEMRVAAQAGSDQPGIDASPAEAATEIVDAAPLGARAVIFANAAQGDATGWEPTAPSAIAIEHGAGVVVPHPRRPTTAYPGSFDDYIAETERWIQTGLG